MNIEGWKKLQEALINEQSITFDMSDWGDREENFCGTSACIAGFACHANGMDIGKMSCNQIAEEAEKILGIEWHQTDHVFFGRWLPKPDGALKQTREEALEYVQRVIDTGYVMVTI